MASLVHLSNALCGEGQRGSLTLPVNVLSCLEHPLTGIQLNSTPEVQYETMYYEL